ncbi:MAG: HD domain-containing phosphohydrolase [Pseudomonadota bacterium]
MNFPTTEISGPPNLYPGFAHFSLRALAPGSFAPCQVRLEAFNPAYGGLHLVKALTIGDQVSLVWRQRLLDSGMVHAYVSLPDLDELLTYLGGHAQKLLDQPGDGDPQQGYLMVYEHALCALKAAMLDPRNGRRLGLGAATVRQLVDALWEDRNTRLGLLKILAKDQELASHSLNTCLLAVGFACHQAWPREKAANLGLAMFYHDLGLVEMGLPGPDDPLGAGLREGASLEEHPELAVAFLAQVPGLDPEVGEIVLCHHENLDGSGYPRGISGDQLSPAARLARLVDVYETATSGAAGRPALPPFSVLLIMRRELGMWLDLALLESFVRFLGQF